MTKGKNRWITSPIDVIAPYSYHMMFVKAPLESLIELYSDHLLYWKGGDDIYNDPTDMPRVSRMSVDIAKWPELLRLGYCEFTNVLDTGYRTASIIVGETKVPDWNIVLSNTGSGFEFVAEGQRILLERGTYSAPFSQAGIVEVRREPDAEGIQPIFDSPKDVHESSTMYPRESHPHRLPLYLGSKGTRLVRVHGRSLVSKNSPADFYVHGICVSESGRFKQSLHWPIDDAEFHYEGIEKMINKRGKLHSRFTDQDISNLMNSVYGLDILNAEFYTGNIVLIDSGYSPLPYNSRSVEWYRDAFMPGWREEI